MPHDATRKNRGIKIVIVTRFSVYNYGAGIFKKFAKDIKTRKDYMAQIYSPKRLDAKLWAFEHITLPSIQRQSYRNFHWYIYTSPTLPGNYLNRLKSLIHSDRRISIKMVNSMEELSKGFERQLKAYSKYISVRLDDDDGIHPQYFKLLAKSYRPGQILNPRSGLKVSISVNDPDNMKYSEHNRPFASSGLARAQGNVISLGDHSTINKRVDSSQITIFPYKELYLYSMHGFNITKDSMKPYILKGNRSLNEYLSQKYLQSKV